MIDGQLDADALKRRMEAVRHANELSVDSRTAKDTFRKLLQKGESEAATQAFDSPDTYNLPAGNTNWRLSNAISWIAGQTKDAERKLDLMKIAGECCRRPRKDKEAGALLMSAMHLLRGLVQVKRRAS